MVGLQHRRSWRAKCAGVVIQNKWCKNRTAQICDQPEEKYHLIVAKNQRKGKSLTNDDIPIKKAVKQKIHLALSSHLEHGISDFNKLKSALKDQGIELSFHAQSTARIHGVNFRTDGLNIKGSAVDRSFSFKNPVKRLSQNQNHHKKHDHGRPMEF